MGAPVGELEVSGKGRAKLPAGFVPIAPGEVRNPKGNNQYTYKRNFENSIDKLLAGDVTDEYLNLVPSHVRELIDARMAAGDKLTRGEVLALITVAGAFQGDEKQLPEVLKRLWPTTEKHEHSTPDGPLELSAGSTRIDMSIYSEAEREQLQGLIHKQLQAKGSCEDE